MEYTVKQLADLAGISGRTLRFYDEINLLKPARKNESGYRIYGQKEVDQLQQPARQVPQSPGYMGSLPLFAVYSVFTFSSRPKRLLNNRKNIYS